MTGNIKQVICIRRDLNMIRGKEIAQGSHASNGPLCDLILKSVNTNSPVCLTDFEHAWMVGSQAIVCLAVNSEEELHQIAKKAKECNLRHSLILDEGRTQFEGIHTYTALSIGPDLVEKINPITGHLKLHVDSRKDKKPVKTGELKNDFIHIPGLTERVSRLVGAFIKEHHTKIFEDVLSGKQRSLIYPKDGIGFNAGDRINLRELSEFSILTGRELDLVVTHVTTREEKHALGIEDNIEIMSISIVGNDDPIFKNKLD